MTLERNEWNDTVMKACPICGYSFEQYERVGQARVSHIMHEHAGEL